MKTNPNARLRTTLKLLQGLAVRSKKNYLEEPFWEGRIQGGATLCEVRTLVKRKIHC